MQKNLSYATYQKLCEKFGSEKIDHMPTIQYSTVDNENHCFSKIDMNVILSQEFIDLISPKQSDSDLDKQKRMNIVIDLSLKYYRSSMPAVEEYILSLIK